MTLWLAVTPDAYELPLAVADSCVDLGALMGVSGKAIKNTIWRESKGVRTKYRVRVVDMPSAAIKAAGSSINRDGNEVVP